MFRQKLNFIKKTLCNFVTAKRILNFKVSHRIRRIFFWKLKIILEFLFADFSVDDLMHIVLLDI